MTSLKLYRFIYKNKIEIDWRGEQEEQLIIWIPFDNIKEFIGIIGSEYLSDGGYDVNLQDNCIALDIIPLCEYYCLDPVSIYEHC